MKINCILTFDKSPQTFQTIDIEPMFPTKESAVYYFKGMVASNKRHLVKVSMCVDTDNPDSLPKWYFETNGKLWSDDLGTVKYNKYWATTSA